MLGTVDTIGLPICTNQVFFKIVHAPTKKILKVLETSIVESIEIFALYESDGMLHRLIHLMKKKPPNSHIFSVQRA
jgi:hypothetical protein